jgi:hypothetical protein
MRRSVSFTACYDNLSAGLTDGSVANKRYGDENNIFKMLINQFRLRRLPVRLANSTFYVAVQLTPMANLR